eukprot:jgi/Botrbrau1/12097/Bobra.0186s0020.1
MLGGSGPRAGADAMDSEKFRSTMSSLNYGHVMAAAARDYQQEVLNKQQVTARPSRDIDIDDLLDDPELERLHAERLACMQKEAEKRAKLQRRGHGELQEITEGDFLETVTNTPHVVTHFFHDGFERCKIMDKHLAILARKYWDTRFVKLSAPDAPFFSVKLGIKILPCVIMFVNGVAVDRIVGFDGLGTRDDFPTAKLEQKLLDAGVISPPEATGEDEDSGQPPEHVRRTVTRGSRILASDDETSDFSD